MVDVMPPPSKRRRIASDEGGDEASLRIIKPPGDEVLAALETALSCLARARKVVVLSGAGISVSCGLPDFRSKRGLYALVKKLALPIPTPESLFDIDYFRSDPLPFYLVAKRLLPGTAAATPSAAHRFIRLLERKRKLLRNYTQNIDALEVAAGVQRVVFCHGSLASATCLRCGAAADMARLTRLVAASQVPLCEDSVCGGVLKPGVTFFGEAVDGRVAKQVAKDVAAADCVLVMGTSLQVAPMSGMLSALPPTVPRLLINRDDIPLPPQRSSADWHAKLLGDADAIVAWLCSILRWPLPPDGAVKQVGKEEEEEEEEGEEEEGEGEEEEGKEEVKSEGDGSGRKRKRLRRACKPRKAKRKAGKSSKRVKAKWQPVSARLPPVSPVSDGDRGFRFVVDSAAAGDSAAAAAAAAAAAKQEEEEERKAAEERALWLRDWQLQKAAVERRAKERMRCSDCKSPLSPTDCMQCRSCELYLLCRECYDRSGGSHGTPGGRAHRFSRGCRMLLFKTE